jgi:zinc protease
MEDFYQSPPSNEELERVRRNYANQVEKILNDHEKIGVALSESIALGDWRLLFQSRERAKNVTSDQVAAAVKKYFRRDNRTVGTYLPEDQLQRAEIPVAPTSVEVLKDFKASEQVATSEAFDPSQANIDARTEHLDIGGLKVSLLPKKNRGETVSVALNLRWGDEKTLFNQQTVSSVAAAMLMRGNAKYTREQLEDEFSKLKISGNINQFDTTRSNLVDALRLVAQVLKKPTFPQTEFNLLRQQLEVNLTATRNEPNTLARQAMAQHFNQYPKGDWRAPLTIDDMLASLKKISLEDVKTFHKEFYGASKGELSVVGDFDPVAIKKIIEEIFGDWKSAKPYTRVAEDFFDVLPMHQKIDTPDKENGFFLARINVNLRDDDPDYPALLVADYIFGGSGLNSRLMQRIRQKDGLSYGGNSTLGVGSLDRAAHFTISAIAAPQNLERLQKAIKEELMKILKDGFTADELARAKSGLIQQRLQTRTQDSALAQGWNNYMFLGRTFAWSKGLEDKVAALTVDKVNAAFRHAIDPEKMSIVIAGDATKKSAK